MRIATYNVEWFTNLFDDEGRLLEDDIESGRLDVTRREQITALGQVFAAIDADAIMVIEAPDENRRRSSRLALENFAERFGLRTSMAVIGFGNTTQQEIALLYDPSVIEASHDPRETEAVPRFDSGFKIDLDTDAAPDLVRWSKPPFEVSARALQSGKVFRMIGVHAKSKAPYGSNDPAEILRISIENRRKQLAQCIWLRKRVVEDLGSGDDVIVLGDFNDGPGLDEYEKLFGRSSVEIVLGEDSGEKLYDPHASLAITQRIGASPTTSRFRIPPEGNFLSALLDYIMISPRLRELGPCWMIWHPFENSACYRDHGLRDALLTASDHFPVTLDIEL